MISAAGVTILLPTLFAGGKIAFTPDAFHIRMLMCFIVAIWFLRKRKTNPIKVMISIGIAELAVQTVILYVL